MWGIIYCVNIELELLNENETLEVGRMIALYAQQPSLVCLIGDLGTGKTCLTKGIAQILEIAEAVTSPTFTLLNSYQGVRGNLYHLDTYRLSDPQELFELGLQDALDDPDGFIVIEWAEPLITLFSRPKIEIHLDYFKKEYRKLNITLHEQDKELYNQLSKLNE